MADLIKDGGPAFPVADFDHQVFQPRDVPEVRRLLSGMTLRDYFAAKALVGILTMVAQGQHDTRDGFDPPRKTREEKLAADAYKLADAMLKARLS